MFSEIGSRIRPQTPIFHQSRVIFLLRLNDFQDGVLPMMMMMMSTLNADFKVTILH